MVSAILKNPAEKKNETKKKLFVKVTRPLKVTLPRETRFFPLGPFFCCPPHHTHRLD